MKYKKRIIFALLCLTIGTLLVLINRKLIIIRFNLGSANSGMQSEMSAHHKTVRLYFKKEMKWYHETTTLVWHSHNDADNITTLVTQWLSVLIDEHIIPLHTTLESTAIAGTGSDVYLSFDRSLFEKNDATVTKWAIVESLMKTLHAVNGSLQSVTLQVHHEPMVDDHLELSSAIPIQEFC